MKKFFNKLSLVFFYGDEIEEVLKQRRKEKEIAEYLKKQNYLNLCERHQQASPGSHYSENNCHYCIEKKKIEAFKKRMDLLIKNNST